MVALALCAGCAHLPAYLQGVGALDYWAAAVEADERGREEMWKLARRDNKIWQVALLQSLPDYSRYDVQAARRALKQTLATQPYGDVAALARVRLAELSYSQACQTHAMELQQRLDKVIAIERKLDGNAP